MLCSESELFQVQMSYIVTIYNDAVGDSMQRGILRLGMSSELACLYATLLYVTLKFALRTCDQSKLFVF